MPTFSYTVKNISGAKKSGSIDAANEDAAAALVARDGWFVSSISKGSSTSSSLFSWGAPSMTAIERIVFTDHMGEMVASGTPIVEAIETYEQEESKKIYKILQDVVSSVQQGKKLSEALNTHPKVFTPYYVALIASGELTGRLDESFKYLAKELRREHEFKEKMMSALMYPIFVVVVAIAVMGLLTIVVIPKITEVTKSFGGDLPLATRIVSGVADGLSHYGIWIFGGLALAMLGLFVSLRKSETRKKLEPTLLKSPVIGKILKHYMLARFLRIMGSCLTYGIPLSKACDTAADILDSSLYKQATLRLKDKIIKGENVADALASEPEHLFPSFIIRSIRGAEKVGTLDAVFIRIATFYENEVDRDLHRLTELIQPVLTVVLGLIVGAIALAVVAPIYQITSKIR